MTTDQETNADVKPGGLSFEVWKLGLCLEILLFQF